MRFFIVQQPPVLGKSLGPAVALLVYALGCFLLTTFSRTRSIRPAKELLLSHPLLLPGQRNSDAIREDSDLSSRRRSRREPRQPPLGFLIFEMVGTPLLWAEAVGASGATFGCLISGSLLVAGSSVLKWVQSPFSHNFSGLKLSLLPDPGINPHLTLFSVGVLGLLVLIGGIFFRKNSQRCLVWRPLF